jgi:hypothetical protein
VVAPPPDVGNQPAAAATRVPAATTERGAPPPSAAAPALDRADIKPLDVPDALQILIAEVRDALELALIDAASPRGARDSASTGTAESAGNAASSGGVGMAATGNLDGATPAARALVLMVLQALPEDLEDAAWSAALPRVEAALQTGIGRALEVVVAWRDVASIVVETTQDAAALALRVLGDAPRNPLWLRPEWLALAPLLTRFRRRRRARRRGFTDPDHDSPAEWDETDDFRP